MCSNPMPAQSVTSRRVAKERVPWLPMLLVKGQKIADYPAPEIRRLMQRIGMLNASVPFIGHVLGCSLQNAEKVSSPRRREGFLRVDDEVPGYVCLTSKGLALSSATLRPISRATATKH